MLIPRARSRPLRLAAAAGLLAAALAGGWGAAAPAGDRADWATVDRLIDEQKLQEAAKVVEALLGRARGRGDDAELARALIRRSQIEIALGGFETAVEELRAEPWPEAPLPRAAVELYDARALSTYLSAYGWEIARRERVAAQGPLDLELWSSGQIAAEIDRAFGRVWARREELGSVPVAAFEWLEPNDYPRRIRPTVRDAVSYLWAGQLADSSRWTPAEAATVWQLDLGTLAAGAPAAEEGGGELHPLARLAAILGDLERWHAGRGETGAALEARLTRLDHLADHLGSDGDLARLRAALAEALPAFRRDPWWSMGMARLAALWRRDGAPGAWIEARRVALAGEEGEPGSPGAAACRRERLAIEQRDFGLQSMTLDGPGERSIAVRHRNLERLELAAWRLEEPPFARRRVDRAWWNDDRVAAVVAAPPTARWSVELPPTPDYRLHRTYVAPPLERPGRYLVVASPDGAFGPRSAETEAVELEISPVVLASATEPGEASGVALVRALGGADGAPRAGAPAILYGWRWQALPVELARGTTDETGLVRFELDRTREFAGLSVVVEAGGVESVWSAPARAGGREPAGTTASGALLFTDRALYRPGQKLYWKALFWRGDAAAGALEALDGAERTVRLVDPNGEAVATVAAVTNRFGSIAGELEIPAGRLLGDWRLETEGGAATIGVEEYRRPSFEVELDAPTGEPRLGGPVEIEGRATYQFGLPVSAGKVAWRVTRAPLRLPHRGFRFWPPPGPARTVAAGVASLDADGRFRIAFVPEADERERGRLPGYRFEVEADLTDAGGETRGTSRGIVVGWVGVELGLEGDRLLVESATAPTWTLRRANLDGEPRPGALRWRIEELAQPATAPLPAALEQPLPEEEAPFATPGDRQRERWAADSGTEGLLSGWPVARTVRSGELRTGAGGEAALTLAPPGPGAYRLVVESDDAHGETARLERPFVVAARSTPLAVPLALAFDRDRARAGETVRLFVHSGLPGATIVLELGRRGEVHERRLLGPGSHWIEIALDEGDRGGIGATATLLSDYQRVARTAELAVPWRDRQLALEVASFRDRFEPGALERIRLTVRDADGAALGAGAAEVVASMYDRSLDLLRPRSLPDGAALWPRFGAPPPPEVALGFGGTVFRGRGRRPELPSAPAYAADAFVEIAPYGIGGPGMRGFPMRRMVESMAAMPAAAPQGLADAAVQKEGAGPTPPPPAEPPRSDFAETAFWEPQLVTDAAGGVGIEFRVPESLTGWRLWASAWTRELASGALEREAVSAKQLMVRPYLPRFLREGDRAELRIAVDNASGRDLSGTVELRVEDPDDGGDLSDDFGLAEDARELAFAVPSGAGTTLTVPLTAPRSLATVAVRVVARAEGLSDGELRPLPILPARVRLTESRFAALRGTERRELAFDALAEPDPTRVDEQLVVTVDGRLFESMLAALPYLVDYPYECTEQTMNRFVSSGILASLFDRYPAVAKLAASLSGRRTRWERFDGDDPNRRMALEETPWLAASRGGDGKNDEALLRVLDPEVAAAVRAEALARLGEAQLPSGAFPWFPGGPPSPYMTLYLLSGFARAAEFGVEVPREMVENGWRSLAGLVDGEWLENALSRDCCWELLTFANYVASSYPDPAWMEPILPAARRREILVASFAHWREHAPMSKLQLAMTLQRMGRPADARLVLGSVMDSARTDPDLGTSWAREERSWLWYRDTVETHAWALRALTAVAPDDPRRAGLVQWLFLNKKLGHWKSTRATAEVLASLAAYLESEELFDAPRTIAVEAGGATTRFELTPGRYEGKRLRVVVPGSGIEPARDATVAVEQRGRGLAFASATRTFTTESLPAVSAGDLFGLERRWYRRVRQGEETVLEPLADGARLEVGDELEVALDIRASAEAEYVHVRDPRPAGLEPARPDSGWRWELGVPWYEEIRDSATNFFFERLPPGEVTLRYRLRAAVAGTFRAAPAELESIYAPEFAAHSAGGELEIAPAAP